MAENQKIETRELTELVSDEEIERARAVGKPRVIRATSIPILGYEYTQKELREKIQIEAPDSANAYAVGYSKFEGGKFGGQLFPIQYFIKKD
ncbi:hypothetical protein KY342_06570 [Candidatus Woesearchaeota archaeon]|nr:hypothetical protein [Candidatus Woesearchaeota archaeon]